MRNLLLFFLLLLCTPSFAAFLRGKLIDADGQALSFASVYLRGTATGTTTNIDGVYALNLAPGEHEIVFQYVGYQSQRKTIQMGEKDQTLDIVLELVASSLQEIVVTAGEDPAYRIIRKAIRKRNYYRNQAPEFSCTSYMKGTQYIQNLPKKIMGFSLEGLGEGLDSTGSGIVYLSESVSDIYYQKGEIKEVMSSSKVSGDDNGFSFNSGAVMLRLSFYDNVLELGDKPILSPIANNALSTYDYRLETSFYDDRGHLVYKIEVLPKNKLAGAVGGYIYIVEEEWAIHSTDLFTTGAAINVSVLDTVVFKQTHLQLEDGTWRLFSQDIDFSLKIMAIETKGNFVGVFSAYNLEPNFPQGFFDAEVFKIEEYANEKMTTFWDSIRPIPLSNQETQEYDVKDSLQKIWKSRSYQDSVDKVANRPQIMSLLNGYTFQNSYRKYSWTIKSPLSNLFFNTVQGQIIGLGAAFNKEPNKKKRFEYKIGLDGEYSLADKQLRGTGFFQMRFNEINDAFIRIEGGRDARQFNHNQPVTELINTYYSLLLKRNYLKLYDDVYGRLLYRQRLLNGLLLVASTRYGRRQALLNATDGSWFPKNPREYLSNHPLDEQGNFFNGTPEQVSFKTHLYWTAEVALRIRLGQKYITYPNQRFHTGSKFPDLWLRYRKGIALLGGQTDYDYLEATIEKQGMDLGQVGDLSFKLTGGWFVNNKSLFFMDYHHFDGNQTLFAKNGAYLSTLQLLPYYKYSTRDAFAVAALEHDFNGFLWNKIPGLKVLGFEFVAGYRALYLPEQSLYQEFNIGLDRIGWKVFRFLRVDFVAGYAADRNWQFGGVIGLDFSL
ncbi:MAG: DUF5686 and carboxypeptidase regulatory-like domain-containing protein [Aureispira sp.]